MLNFKAHVIFLGAAFACVSAAHVQASSFTYGSGVPAASSANSRGVFPLLEAISDKTSARVSFRKLVGGTVVKVPTGLQSARDGIVDASFAVMQFHPTDLPNASLVAELGGLGTNPFATFGAINEFMFSHCPTCMDDFDRNGVVPLYVQSATPLVMACTKPLDSMSSLKGKKALAIGAPELRWAASLGMKPARTRFSEVLQQLQLGNADCFITPLSWIKSYGLSDVIRSVIEMPQGVVSGALPVLFNKKSWQRIAKKDRQAILKLLPKATYHTLRHAYIDFDASARADLQGKATFSGGDSAMKKAWTKYQADERNALIDLLTRRKMANPDVLVDQAVEIFRRWHIDYAEQLKSEKGFVDLMWRHVYSKIKP